MVEATKDPVYIVPDSEPDRGRLQRQAEILDPSTIRLSRNAGLAEDMRALDLGSGAGEVELLPASLVGPRGAVGGIDRNPDVLATARERAMPAPCSPPGSAPGRGFPRGRKKGETFWVPSS